MVVCENIATHVGDGDCGSGESGKKTGTGMVIPCKLGVIGPWTWHVGPVFAIECVKFEKAHRCHLHLQMASEYAHSFPGP